MTRIDNPETLATLGTQDTGRRQTKLHTKNITQKTKIYYFTYNALKHLIEIFIMSVHIMFQTLPT